ncbi:MAG: hypothetical protein RL254_1981, partial [Planctomycetota bacterium]
MHFTGVGAVSPAYMLAITEKFHASNVHNFLTRCRAAPARVPKSTFRGDAARAAGAVQTTHMGPLPSGTRSPARQVHLSFSYGQ